MSDTIKFGEPCGTVGLPEEKDEDTGEIFIARRCDDNMNNKKERDPPIPFVLEPDHPMMERFQKALKNHLLKQLDRLSNQVFEMDNETKTKEKEKEQTALELYAMQHEMYRQQKLLEDCENTIESLVKERQALDESVRTKKKNWKEEIDKLNIAKKKENDMAGQYQKLLNLEKQMETWQKEMETELTVSQRISEKAQYDKNKLIDEKRKMDMYLLRVMTEVSNYEAEIKLLDGEAEVKQEEKDNLNQTLADAAADLQALMAEQKRLLSSWNSVICTINQRNAVYADVQKDLTEAQEAFRLLQAEIDSYKKSSSDEMKKSEKLALLLARFELDLESNENALKLLMNKKLHMEEKITSLATMIQRTETEHQFVLIEREKVEVNLRGILKGLEKLVQEKRFYEDEAMKEIQDQIQSNKTASHINRLLRENREKIRKQEFNILEMENKISKKFLEVEELKETILDNNEIIKELSQELTVKEDELKTYEEEIEKCQSAVIQKQGNYATLTRKIEKCMEKTGYGKIGQSPLQIRIVELERANSEMQAKNDKMQSFWLLQQQNNVKLAQQRNEQMKVISLLRKQVMLLEQRALKIETEYEVEQKKQHDVDKSINRLQHKLMSLNEILMGKKDHKANLGKENCLVQVQYVQNLKESELEQIQLKGEIKDLETSLEELAENMLEVQREILAWEKKIQTATETKCAIQKAKSDLGEVGQMKSEIHRMEVRYGHLKRVQEKLIGDLEQCVLRRDAILDGADANEKRQARGFNTRYTLQKKVEGLRNRISTVANDIKKMQRAIANAEETHQKLKESILEKESEIEKMDETTQTLDLKLQDGKLQKVMNLETLVRRQKKCKLYEEIKNRKYRLLYKSEGSLGNEFQKAKTINTNLVSIMETLIEDFPAHRFQLKKIYNTLRAKPS